MPSWKDLEGVALGPRQRQVLDALLANSDPGQLRVYVPQNNEDWRAFRLMLPRLEARLDDLGFGLRGGWFVGRSVAGQAADRVAARGVPFPQAFRAARTVVGDPDRTDGPTVDETTAAVASLAE